MWSVRKLSSFLHFQISRHKYVVTTSPDVSGTVTVVFPFFLIMWLYRLILHWQSRKEWKIVACCKRHQVWNYKKSVILLPANKVRNIQNKLQFNTPRRFLSDSMTQFQHFSFETEFFSIAGTRCFSWFAQTIGLILSYWFVIVLSCFHVKLCGDCEIPVSIF